MALPTCIGSVTRHQIKSHHTFLAASDDSNVYPDCYGRTQVQCELSSSDIKRLAEIPSVVPSQTGPWKFNPNGWPYENDELPGEAAGSSTAKVGWEAKNASVYFEETSLALNPRSSSP